MIVYHCDGDEIHMALCEKAQFDVLEKILNQEGSLMNIGNQLIEKYDEFFEKGLIEKQFTQTFCSEDSIIKDPIKKIIHIPMY